MIQQGEFRDNELYNGVRRLYDGSGLLWTAKFQYGEHQGTKWEGEPPE